MKSNPSIFNFQNDPTCDLPDLEVLVCYGYFLPMTIHVVNLLYKYVQ